MYSRLSCSSKRALTFCFRLALLLLVVGSVLYIEQLLSETHSYLHELSIPLSKLNAPEDVSPSESVLEDDDTGGDHHQWNERTLQKLRTCIAENNCGVNQLKIAILGAFYFEERIIFGRGGGEGIWGQSMYNTMHSLGYTTFFANHWSEALELYQLMPDMIKVVILLQPAQCQNEPGCVKGPDNPTGIPAWKIFDLSYWPSYHHNATRLDGKWVITSHSDILTEEKGEESPYQYIGYVLKLVKQCRRDPVIPLSDRKNQIWLFMKLIRYAYDGWFAWDKSWFAKLAEETGLTIVGGWEMLQDYPENPSMEDFEDREHGVVNLGPQDHPAFIDEVRNSKAMLAVGGPTWSPTPWEALCHGVPFIHPIRNFDPNDPWNRLKWEVQHPVLKMFHEPYVYHVRKGNYTELLQAIRKATTTPIESFIPDFMTEEAFRKRIQDFMETDWRSLAVKLLEQRKAANDDSYIFEL